MLQYAIFIAAFLTSMVICMIAIPSIVRVAKTRGLFDIPDKRATGRKNIPTLGGLAIFAGVIISLSLFSDFYLLQEFPFLILGLIILFFIGIKDDILIIAPRWKLSGQVLAAGSIVILGGLRIHDLGGLMGIKEIPTILSVFFTILVMVFIINSFNLIDGIDGLASGLGILSSIVFGLVFCRSGLYSWTILAIVLCGALAGFIRYNVFGKNKKIFMGDTGSLLLGFLQAVMLVRFLNMDDPALFGFRIQSPLSFMFGILIVPLFDTLRIIVLRIIHARSPFRPDRRHIHYLLIDSGLSHIQAASILIGINLCLLILALVLGSLGELPVILILMAVSAILSFISGKNINQLA